jgi:hypothetical protein
MTTREQCKRVGISSAKELARFHDVTPWTVSYWRRTDQEIFDRKLAEAAVAKRRKSEKNIRN